MGLTVRGVSRPRIPQSRDIFYFSLQLDLRENAEGIVDLDAEVADSAFEFDVSRSELDPLRFPSSLQICADLVRRTECVP